MFSGLNRLLLSCIAMILVSGCGSSDQPELGQVDGTITMDNAPLAGVEVLFGPEGARSSAGYTDQEGHYTLYYLAGVEGAVLGEHRVEVRTPIEDESDPETEASFVEKIPPKYNSQSELTAVVEAGDNTFDFNLESQ
ncbi:hypothetical protein Pan258_06440 [Symmachiella dynata]|nr:hypothetical protein Pan258_06440 [Symmachiella dynata]